MKTLTILCIVCCSAAYGQQEEWDLVENNASRFEEAPENMPDDEQYSQNLAYYREHKVNLNGDELVELEELNMLTPIQIDDLQRYKKIMGELICLQELQAVPGWDIPTIHRLLPFITVRQSADLAGGLLTRITDGEHSLLVRTAIKPGITKKDAPAWSKSYQGSPLSLLTRYSYAYKNTFQYGILGEKDPGEQFLKGRMKGGFDFYSFHLFIRKIGGIKALAVGDYTVNLGQGLIHWQSLAFGKSSTPINIKRQSEVLHPYRSAGEFNFERGIGVTVQRKRIEMTLFLSHRKLSANIVTDSMMERSVTVSSIQASGYHRTLSELEDKNVLGRSTAGGTLQMKREHFKIGLNAIVHHYSQFIQKKEEPYHQFSIKGSNWFNYSVDFDAGFHPVHIFGEMAMDKLRHPAFVCGLMASMDHAVDIALLYRNIRPGYQSVAGNAFTENVLPENEEGYYLGVSLHLSQELQLNGYVDIFRFPWLKYRVDAPSNGNDYLLQLEYRPNKMINFYSRWKIRNTETSENIEGISFSLLEGKRTINGRTHISYHPYKSLLFENRLEWKRSASKGESVHEEGFLVYTEISYHPFGLPASGSLRLQYFEAPGFGTRIYAYEKDLQYAYSIPSFYGKGFRYYINLKIKSGKHAFPFKKLIKDWTFSIKWSQTLELLYIRQASQGDYPSIGKKEIRMQMNIRW